MLHFAPELIDFSCIAGTFVMSFPVAARPHAAATLKAGLRWATGLRRQQPDHRLHVMATNTFGIIEIILKGKQCV